MHGKPRERSAGFQKQPLVLGNAGAAYLAYWRQADGRKRAFQSWRRRPAIQQAPVRSRFRSSWCVTSKPRHDHFVSSGNGTRIITYQKVTATGHRSTPTYRAGLSSTYSHLQRGGEFPALVICGPAEVNMRPIRRARSNIAANLTLRCPIYNSALDRDD